MKIPRDVSATELIKRLAVFGYIVSRQTGSHIRITTLQKGQHHLTIPNHDPIKIGTLSSILSDIAQHFSITKEELIRKIWG
jgi:predicted RNA binding protein YcfA (HicA-like mRNA interferase family)